MLKRSFIKILSINILMIVRDAGEGGVALEPLAFDDLAGCWEASRGATTSSATMFAARAATGQERQNLLP